MLKRRWLYFARSGLLTASIAITVFMLAFFAIVGDPPWLIIFLFIPLFALVSLGEYARLPGFRRRPLTTKSARAALAGRMPSYADWDPSLMLIGEYTDQHNEKCLVAVWPSGFSTKIASAMVVSAENPEEVLGTMRQKYQDLRATLIKRGATFRPQRKISDEEWRSIFGDLEQSKGS